LKKVSGAWKTGIFRGVYSETGWNWVKGTIPFPKRASQFSRNNPDKGLRPPATGLSHPQTLMNRSESLQPGRQRPDGEMVAVGGFEPPTKGL